MVLLHELYESLLTKYLLLKYLWMLRMAFFEIQLELDFAGYQMRYLTGTRTGYYTKTTIATFLRLSGFCPGLPGLAGTRKVKTKPI